MDASNVAAMWVALLPAAVIGVGGLAYTRRWVQGVRSGQDTVPWLRRAHGVSVVWGGFAGVLFLVVAAILGLFNRGQAWSGHGLPLIVAVAVLVGLVVALGVYWHCLLVARCWLQLMRRVTRQKR